MKKLFLIFIIYTSLFSSNKNDQLLKNRILGILQSNDLKIEQLGEKRGSLIAVYMAGGDLVYVDLESKFIFYGGVVMKSDKDEIINLTKKDKDVWDKKLDNDNKNSLDFKSFSKIAILDKINGGNDKKELIMFDSLTCGFCRKINQYFINNNKKVNIYRVYNANGNIEGLLADKFGIKDPKERIKKMEQLFRKFKVLGTPYIMTLDKNRKIETIIRGANMKEIKKWAK